MQALNNSDVFLLNLILVNLRETNIVLNKIDFSRVNRKCMKFS